MQLSEPLMLLLVPEIYFGGCHTTEPDGCPVKNKFNNQSGEEGETIDSKRPPSVSSKSLSL
jgi:hypothetical protein